MIANYDDPTWVGNGVKKILIIGGTGTLGQALIKKLENDDDVYKVSVLSRDELKQKILLKYYPKVKMILGDVRNKESLLRAMRGITDVYHFAALKHVDILESNIEEAIATNLTGLIHSAQAAIKCRVARFLFTSTDKAVKPINVYGMTKGLAERYLLKLNEENIFPRFFVFRWGNIIGSRGSVIPQFLKALDDDQPISITDNKMTRFWLNIDDAVDFMFNFSLNDTDKYGVYVPKMKSSSVMGIINACAVYKGKELVGLKNIGIRPGEKIHEDITEDRSSNDQDDIYSEEELIAMVSRCQ